MAVVEFSDFECPFCSKVAPMMMKLVEENPKAARVHFMQNPLDMACNPRLSKPFHKNACNGAKAAICADEQGAFWKMHDKLFENQRALGAPALSEYAKELGLTVKEFDDCMASERPGKIIERDLALSKRVGVRGTPTIVIGDRLIPGALPYWKLKGRRRS